MKESGPKHNISNLSSQNETRKTSSPFRANEIPLKEKDAPAGQWSTTSAVVNVFKS